MAWQDVKRLEQKSKESLEEKKNSISKKVLQRLTPKPKNFIQTPKLEQFARGDCLEGSFQDCACAPLLQDVLRSVI